MPKRLTLATLILLTSASVALGAGNPASGTGAADSALPTADSKPQATGNAGSGSSGSTGGSGTGNTGGSGAKVPGTGNAGGSGTKAPGTGSPASGSTGGSGAKASGSGSTGSGSSGAKSTESGSAPPAGQAPKAHGTGNGGAPKTGTKGTGSGNGAAAGSKTGASAQPHEISVGRFSAGELSGWKDKPFKGKTEYSLEGTYLKAHALKASSGLIREIRVDTKKYPKISWSWKVDHSLKREDIKSKKGDDFAARVYVIFPRTFFWRMRAINYVWAGKMPKGSEAPSPYTSNSVIVAVESGDEKAGTLVHEERNIYEDYKRIFGEEPPLLGGVAILTDTDDTQDEATAWYGDITLGAP